MKYHYTLYTPLVPAGNAKPTEVLPVAGSCQLVSCPTRANQSQHFKWSGTPE